MRSGRYVCNSPANTCPIQDRGMAVCCQEGAKEAEDLLLRDGFVRQGKSTEHCIRQDSASEHASGCEVFFVPLCDIAQTPTPSWEEFAQDLRDDKLSLTDVIDFSLRDRRDPSSQVLLERMYCYDVLMDGNTTMVLHVQTIEPWDQRAASMLQRARHISAITLLRVSKGQD
eukprot:761214-Hanusia_phi.AAC.1